MPREQAPELAFAEVDLGDEPRPDVVLGQFGHFGQAAHHRECMRDEIDLRGSPEVFAEHLPRRRVLDLFDEIGEGHRHRRFFGRVVRRLPPGAEACRDAPVVPRERERGVLVPVSMEAPARSDPWCPRFEFELQSALE